ncbi:MAG: flavin reductase [Burkholderiaceae bacterium]|nr:flavin reductase [Burkholderiaceae bacterium]
MNPLMTPLEAGSPADDGRAFRRSLGQFATGVTVITARHGEQWLGMTVNSFAALSLDPPLVLWSIRRESGALQAFQTAGHFAVNVLAANQVALSNRFASSKADKFGATPWTAGVHGAPLLHGAIGHLECTLHEVVEGGDHLLLVGRVERHARFGGEPLLFTQGRYAVTQEHPEALQADAGAAPVAVAHDVSRGTILRLLHHTSNRMSQAFLGHRLAEGLSVAQFRIYGWLRDQAHTAEDLKRLAYLGGRDADDTLAGLCEQGQLTRDDAGCYHLTPAGRERAQAIVRHVEAFEAELLQEVSEADLAATRRVLGLLAERTARSVA